MGLIAAMAVTAGADERGAPIFGDTFDVVGTFAENWVSVRADGSDGGAKIPSGGSICWRGALPLEFVMEADVTVQPKWSKFVRGEKNGGWGGFFVDGSIFCVRDTGFAFMVYKPAGEKHSSGKYPKIKDFVKGQPNRLRLVRKVQGGSAKYAFYVNDESIGEYMTVLPKKVKGKDGQESYEPVTLRGYNVDIEVDNFALSSVRHDDDSPNMVYNSGFEYDEEGLPTHYNLFGRFPWGKRPNAEFEGVFLKRWGVDTVEKRSGKQSLRATLSPALAGDLDFLPWQVGVVKGQPGVFSLYAKTDVPGGVSIQMNYGSGRAVHKLDNTWRRFEVGCTNLPAKFVYSNARVRIIGASKFVGHVWFDDLQAEIVPMPEGGRFDPKKTYATKYLVSELDASRFGAQKIPALPPTVRIAKLPKGVKPTVKLDAWTKSAAKVGPFWVVQAKPRRDTVAWAACDDDNLYLAFRNFGEDASLLKMPQTVRDHNFGNIFSRDSLELFLKPVADGEAYHLFAAANGDSGDFCGNNQKWNGTWTVAAAANAQSGSVDYLVTLPFADFAPNGFSGKWTCNLCRNDRHGEAVSAGECQSTAKTVKLSYNQPETWGAYELPADVAAKWIARAAELKAAAGGGSPRILGRLDYYMNEPEAKFRVWDANGAMTEHSLDIAKLPYGTNKVTVSGLATEVVKLPYRKGATQVNRFSRSLIHDGKPVLFTGIFIGDNGFSQGNDEKKWDAILDLFETYGFKYSHILTGPKRGCVESTQYLIDEGAKRGIPFIFWGKFSDKDFLVRERHVPADMVLDEAEMVKAFPFDNILSYIVMDEPELGMPSDKAREYLTHMKTYFPYTPCQMNNTVLGIPSRYADLKTDILMLDDYLTNNENRTVDSVVSQVDCMIAADPGKPCWYFIVGDNISLHYKFPNYAEQVAQSWGCLCAGCTGISWYIGIPGAMGSWRACVDVNREAQELAPVLLDEELVPSATATEGRKKLRHLTKRHDGAWYVLTCNVDREALENVTFTLPKDAPQDGSVEVLYENRTIPLRGGTFTDSYAGHTRHLYVIKGK